MAFRSLDAPRSGLDNFAMERKHNSQLRLVWALLGLCSALTLAGCAGVSAGTNAQTKTPTTTTTSGSLAVTPSALNFGNVTVGNSSNLTGTLTASSADVTVSSAAWNGSGYSVSGITFPLTLAAGQSANYTVTFTPPAAGSSPGGITFSSNASDASLQQTFAGAGTQTSSQHQVALTWNASTSSVVGYNLYRGTQTGGPYSTKLNSALISATNYTDGAVQSGTTYYYVSTSVDANNTESAYSNEASAAIP
jgi:hypothetical protein